VVDAAPFRALRYDPAVAGDPAATSAPAYDDLERFAYARHRTASPYTVLELLAAGASSDYHGATAAFARWRRTGVVVEDPSPAFYRYDIHELRDGVPAVLRGVMAAVAVDGDLLAHERVDPARVAARVRRLEAVPVDLAPVFAVHAPAAPALRDVLDAAPHDSPLVAVTDEAGAHHRIWRLDDAGSMQSITEGLEPLTAIIADGHHRVAAAAELARVSGRSDRILAHLVDRDVDGPELRAVHRLIRGLPAAELERRVSDDFTWERVRSGSVEELGDVISAATGTTFGAVMGDGTTAVVTPRDIGRLRERMPSHASEAWRMLDTAVWDAGIRPAGGEVEYRSDPVGAAAEIAGDPDAVLFVLRPPRMEEVTACASAGEAMPVKTTSFRPKPRAGLIMRSLH
jgi:uncharacterized protein (DUF1015 family)